MTDSVDTTSVENATAVSLPLSDVSNYRQAYFFLIIKRIEDSETPLHDVSLSHVTSIRALSRIYGFDYFRCTLSMRFHAGMISDNLTTYLNSSMIAGRQNVKNGAKIL